MQAPTPREYLSAQVSNRESEILRLTLSIAALIFLAATPVAAETSGPFPGSPVNQATMRLGERVEELFENGEYERAFFIYRNELAPIGDKYAQYMVGFMYETGTWVEENPVLASAWYRLAAERGYREFEDVRDAIMNNFTDTAKGRSDELYLQLRREYSDVVILLRLIEQDYEAMTARTGSRISGGANPVTIVDPRAGSSVSGDEYFRRLRSRIEARLQFMAQQLGDPSIATQAEDADVEALSARVGSFVEVIDDRTSFVDANP